MKIKKIFGLASIYSLAILMTACGKNTKNDGFLDSDFYREVATKKEDYVEKNKTKKDAIKVFENQTINTTYSKTEAGIIVTSDSRKYYIYNLKLKDDNKKILEVNKDDVYSISVKTGDYYGKWILVTFNKNSKNLYGYAAYMLNGKTLLEKTYVTSAPNSYYNTSKSSRKINMFDTIYYVKYNFNYYVMEDGEEVKKNSIYCEVSKSEYMQSDVEYYTEEEFDNLYSEKIDKKLDGEAFGLKGYEVQSVAGKTYIYKKNKLVNAFSAGNLEIVSDGYGLTQLIQEVSSKDKYDLFYGGRYLKVKTYKYNLLNSKMSEVKNFHYYIADYGDWMIKYDENGNSICYIGAMCSVLDFKEKKTLFDADLKMAIIKGNGDIEVSKKLVPSSMSSNTVIDDNNTFYSYTTSTTTVYDKNGKLIEVYDGIYYDGIIVRNGDYSTTNFIDKTGKVVLCLKNATAINRFKYTGYDKLGNFLVAIIDNGTVKTADLKDYNSNNSSYLEKVDEDNVHTFYAYDDTLTKMNLKYDSDDETFDVLGTYEGTKYYYIYDQNDYTYAVLYFE